MAVAAAMLAAGCSRPAPPPRQVVRPVTAVEAVARDTPIYVESFGTLAPAENIDVKAEVTGKVISYHFTEGSLVNKGELLFVIDTNQYVASVHKAQASLEQGAANLKRKRDSYERNRTLRDQNVISADEFEQFKTDYDDAQAAYKLAAAQLALSQLDLDHCTIEAPVTGFTGQRLIDPGNIVPANTGPSLVNIKRVDLLRLDFTIPEKYFFQAREASASNTIHVFLTPQGMTGVAATGTVNFINNAIDDQTGTIGMRADVPNAAGTLWAGQFVTIKLIIGTIRNATLVPYESVQNGQKGPYLFVVTPANKADLRLVKSGLRHDDLIVIEEGVKPGEKVVRVGQMGLAPGIPVELLAPGSK